MLCSQCNVRARALLQEWTDENDQDYLVVTCANCGGIYYQRVTLGGGQTGKD